MISTIIYTIFSILGLSFLIFIHELGHYWMARRVGMRVEVFSIGFGHPIYSWQRNGVNWKLGWLLFGGYVKIAGMSGEKDEDPYSIPDGFFGKKPFDRIKVAFMGPFVNLLFAIVVFSGLWLMGGREKNFSEYTHIIGWVDPKSELYLQGIRPGDEILSYDNRKYRDSTDHLFAPLIAKDEITVKGNKVNYATGEKTPFEVKVKPYHNPRFFDKKIKTAGILESARYVIYNRLPNGKDNPIPANSPIADSGLQYGDRVLWIDGEVIFSREQVDHLLNDNRILLTVKRGDKIFLRRIPRVHVIELKPDAAFREELVDWQHEADLNGVKFDDLYAIPYTLTHDCAVEQALKFIDKDKEDEVFQEHPFSDLEFPLQPGDHIIAVQGVPVDHSYQILSQVQQKHVNVIVERDPSAISLIPWNALEGSFIQKSDWENLGKISRYIGTSKQISDLGTLHLLHPITPIKRTEIAGTPEEKAWMTTELQETRRKIEQIEDSEKRAFELSTFDHVINSVVLGIPNLQDRHVTFNPRPIELFDHLATQIYRTLYAMLTGTLSPEHLAGPVGIVRIVQGSSMVSLKEALFWLGAISLNLGVLNLLPVPMLDGGTIIFCLFEMVTGYRIKPKIMEAIIMVFATLLVIFFLFVTYNDILRIFN